MRLVQWVRDHAPAVGIILALSTAVLGKSAVSAADLTVAAPPPPTLASSFFSLPAWPGPSTGPTWRVGGYVGKMSNDPLVNIVFLPWSIGFERSYIADAQAIYTAYRFERIPLDLEVEADVAHRFGMDHQSEVDLIPMARWKWLPWNNIVYTNVRLGLLGASYVSGISQTEINRSGVHHGSRYLNFLVPELTFAPNAESWWEVFVRVHHRSGIYGLIDGISGGSNYVAVGARFNIP